MDRAEKMDWADYVFIALGSNLGASAESFLAIQPKLQQFSQYPMLESSWWKSSPVDCPPGSPEFLNAVCAFKPLPGITARNLLRELQTLEHKFGRIPKKLLNEPRPLDLDIISFRNEIRNQPDLILPHPRAHQRRFVLQPLAEIAPELVLPGFSNSVKDLLRDLKSEERLTRIEKTVFTKS